MPSFAYRQGSGRAIRGDRRRARAARAAGRTAGGVQTCAGGGRAARARRTGRSDGAVVGPGRAAGAQEARCRPRGAAWRAAARVGRRPRRPARDRVLRRDGSPAGMDRRRDARRARLSRLGRARGRRAVPVHQPGAHAGVARGRRQRAGGAVCLGCRGDPAVRPRVARRRSRVCRADRRARHGDRDPLGDAAGRSDRDPGGAGFADSRAGRNVGHDARVHGDRPRRRCRRAPLAALGLARRRRVPPERAAAGGLARGHVRGPAGPGARGPRSVLGALRRGGDRVRASSSRCDAAGVLRDVAARERTALRRRRLGDAARLGSRERGDGLGDRGRRGARAARGLRVPSANEPRDRRRGRRRGDRALGGRARPGPGRPGARHRMVRRGCRPRVGGVRDAASDGR